MKKNSLVLYKNSCAIVNSEEIQGKFSIQFMQTPATATKKAVYATQNVRAKDVFLLHEGPVSSLEKVLLFAQQNVPGSDEIYEINPAEGTLAYQIKEVHELLVSDEETSSQSINIEEAASLIRGAFIADEAWGLYRALKETVFFTQVLKDQLEGKISFIPRSEEEITELVKKADEKGKEAQIREEFISRLRALKLNLPDDAKYMVDVEALALGKTDKSRTLHDAHIKETPERAHKLLLDTGIWDITRNPYPVRWGLSMQSATEGLESPPENEERTYVESVAYAIDNEWSTDPDDAVAYDGKYLWVHIADPASTVKPESSVDKAARGRGATLYLPEGASRMLSESSLADYALGLNEKSKALSFRLQLDEDGNVTDCDVLKTTVNVKRLTYTKADELKDTPELKPLFEIAKKNIESRNRSGAVQIDIPEVHIIVDPQTKKVKVEPEVHPQSADMIREMMLLAGEGAALFAFKNNIPFPYVSQEAPEIPSEIPSGLAGQFRLRKCMRKRSVGITPSMHCGLGIAMYSQVTSPLRRYSDLIAHMQLRSFIDGREVLDKDTMLLRVSEGDAAAVASRQAERKSDLHWKLVYLLQNPDWRGEAVCVDRGAKQMQFFIPSLAMETFITVQNIALNDTITVRAANINIPELTVDFIQC